MRSGGRGTRRERRIAAARRQNMIPGSPLAAPYRPLGDADVMRVHRAALDLLERVGMAAPTARIREVALSQGCSLSDTGRLLYPRALVEDTLAKAAGRFTVHGRDPRFDFEARNGTVNFCTGGAAVKMLDLDTRDYRPSTLRDVYDLARLCDVLDNLQWFARPVVATDVEDLFEFDANTLYACAAGTKKHVATRMTYREISDPIYPPGPHDGITPPIGAVVTIDYGDGAAPIYRVDIGGEEGTNHYGSYRDAVDSLLVRGGFA